MKVEKQVIEAMNWMNSKMNEQSKQSLMVEPVIKASEIQAKTKVLMFYIIFLFYTVSVHLKSKSVFRSFDTNMAWYLEKKNVYVTLPT